MRPPAAGSGPVALIGPSEQVATTDAGCPRLAAWHRMTEAVGRVRDRLGKPVDPSIRDTVAALNLLGFPTSQSCEGHADVRGHGLPAPWVDFADAASAGLPGRLQALLDGFYAGRRVLPDIRLRYSGRYRRLSNGGSFEELDGVSRKLAEGRLTPAETQGLREALAARQAEMQRFTQFLLRGELSSPDACPSGGFEGVGGQAP